MKPVPALAVTDKELLSIQTKGKSGDSGSAPADQFRDATKLIAYVKREVSDHFRGVTKMVVYGNVEAIGQFSTQCEENLNEVPV